MSSRVIPEAQVGSKFHKKLLPGPSGTSPQVFGCRVRVFLHIDDPLAARVQQQLAAGHAWAGRHVGCVDGIHVSALEQCILLSMDCLAAIEVRATWRLGPFTSMAMDRYVVSLHRHEVSVLMMTSDLIAVRKPSRDAVVPC